MANGCRVGSYYLTLIRKNESKQREELSKNRPSLRKLLVLSDMQRRIQCEYEEIAASYSILDECELDSNYVERLMKEEYGY